MRFVLLAFAASLLTFTTSPVDITDGLERLMSPLQALKVPTHEIALMMSIALRFIPTLWEETEKIRKAQLARGAKLESGSFRQRMKSYLPILIPLFLSAFRRAEELALAMESRCYRGGIGRTKYRLLRFTWRDLVMLLLLILLSILLWWWRK
jgi:energy-coupling factor transport system permease protein